MRAVFVQMTLRVHRKDMWQEGTWRLTFSQKTD